MVDTCFTHVSVQVDDVDEAVDFYGHVFEMEPIPTPDFDETIRWVACGDLQLHFVEIDAAPPEFNHFALHVSDFETAYRRLVDHDGATFEALGDPDEEFVDGAPPVYRMPNDSVQTYFRDPSDNFVEVDFPDADAIDESVVTNLRVREDVSPPAPGEPEPVLYGDAFAARIGLR